MLPMKDEKNFNPNTEPNPFPRVCNHCGSRVVLCTNDVVYGRTYGYPWIYYCPTCGAYVGCHRGTKRALGLLATETERRKRHRLHELFDRLWKGKRHAQRKRDNAYAELSKRLGREAHFGWMTEEELNVAYTIVKEMLNECQVRH